jgi:Spy/CpxP family protein refolding chaperone
MEAYMNRFRSITAGAVVAGLLAGGAAFAQGGRDGGPAGPGARAGGRGPMPGGALALRGVNLAEVQQQQVRDIRERHRQDAQQAAQRVRDAMQAQRAAVEAIPVNEGLIRSTTFALAEAQTEAAIQQARVNSDVWSVLTPEQQEQVRKVRAERETRLQQRVNRQRLER